MREVEVKDLVKDQIYNVKHTRKGLFCAQLMTDITSRVVHDNTFVRLQIVSGIAKQALYNPDYTEGDAFDARLSLCTFYARSLEERLINLSKGE